MSDDMRDERTEDEQGDANHASVEAEVTSSESAPGAPEQPGATSTDPRFQTGKAIPSEIRQWAMFCHLAGLASWVVPWIGGIVGTLILWQVKREEHPFVDDQGKAALNFNITVAIAEAVCIPLACIYVGFFLFFAVAVAGAVFAIMAALKANEGERYRYPFSLTLVK